MKSVLMCSVGVTALAMSSQLLAQPASKPAPSKPVPPVSPPAAQPSTAPLTGIACTQGFTSNRGVWIDIDRHSRFGDMISLGGLDQAFFKKVFPEYATRKRTIPPEQFPELAVGITLGTCKLDGSGNVLASCTSETTTAPVATLTYSQGTDMITVRRTLGVTNLKLEVVKNDKGTVELKVELKAELKKRKLTYSFSSPVGTLQSTRKANDFGRPQSGCALLSGVNANALQ